MKEKEICPDSEGLIYELLSLADAWGARETRFVLDNERLTFYCKSKNILSTTNTDKMSAHILSPDFPIKVADFTDSLTAHIDPQVAGENEGALIFNFRHGSEDWQAAIRYKLANLEYPNLFLNNIRKIFYDTGELKGVYDKRVEYSENNGDIAIELVKMRKSSRIDSEKMIDERLWIFSRLTEGGQKYSVGFFIDENEELIARSLPAFNPFPTGERTGLNFVINTPFQLGENRQGLEPGEKDNIKMLGSLAELCADSLECLKELGIRSDVRLVNENICDIIPYNPALLGADKDGGGLSYLPFYQAVQNKFQHSALIPSSDGYIESSHAYGTDDPRIMSLFSRNVLRELTGDGDADWAFPGKGRQIREDHALGEFVSSVTKLFLDEDKILAGCPDGNGNRLELLNSKFVEGRSFAWLDKFYKWILEDRSRIQAVKDAPIFLDQNKKAFSIQDGKRKTGLPDPGCCGDTEKLLHPELLEFDNARKLIEHIKNHS